MAEERWHGTDGDWEGRSGQGSNGGARPQIGGKGRRGRESMERLRGGSGRKGIKRETGSGG